jgi:hypothetical protein
MAPRDIASAAIPPPDVRRFSMPWNPVAADAGSIRHGPGTGSIPHHPDAGSNCHGNSDARSICHGGKPLLT